MGSTIKGMINKHMRLSQQSRLFVVLASLLLLVPATSSQEVGKSSATMNDEERCTSNLKDIFKLLGMWVHQSGGVVPFPSDLRLVYPLSKEPAMFVCPADKGIKTSGREGAFRTSYKIVNDPFKASLSKTSPDRIAVVAEKGSNHSGKRLVLFWDGSVKAFDYAEFLRLRDDSFIDKDKR